EESCWARRKAKLLVKLLALQPHRQLHREQVMEYLWPEQELEAAVNNLHKTIHAARRALEPQLKSGAESNFILTQDQRVLLRAPGGVWVDVEAFERRAAEALKGAEVSDYEAALELYRGDLLGEDPYEDWVAARREQLRLLWQRLLKRLAQLHEAGGSYQSGIERLGHLASANPSDEETHRSLMRLYALTGSRHLALQQYQQCRAALRSDLDAEPERATTELYEQIVAGRIQPVGQAAPVNAIASAREASLEESPTPSPACSNGHQADADQLLQPSDAGEASGSLVRGGRELLGSRHLRFGRLAAVALVVVVAVGLYWRAERDRPIDSVAVLPFANESADPGIEYLSDGITENIIYSLSHLPALRVMARTTAFRYKGKQVDPQTVGRDLRVQAVLTGRVLHRGDDLIIQADLVNVRDGSQIWGAEYKRKLTDIFTVQREIAQEITQRLRLRLTSDEQRRLARRQTDNLEAWQHYLKGRYYWNKRTLPETHRALEHFNQAIALDPGYALPYSGVADCYHTLSNLQIPPVEAIPLARGAALKALELDDQLAPAPASLAMVKWRYEWDWDGAAGEFQRAIALDPNYATAHQWYGIFLICRRQFEAGTAELEQAQRLDPLSLVITGNLGMPHYFARQPDEAITHFRRALELDQNFAYGHFFMGWALEQKGEYETAIAEFQRATQLDDTSGTWSYLGHGYGVAGRRREAEMILDKLQARARERYVSPYYLALVSAGLDEKDRALDYLSQAAADHSDPMVLLSVDPKLDNLRSTPRFTELARRVGPTR